MPADLPAVPDPHSAADGSLAGMPNSGVGGARDSGGPFDAEWQRVNADYVEIGAFTQGNPASRWALARYLVGRAVGESISRSMLVVGLAVLAIAGLVAWAGSTPWTVLIAIVGLGVLLLRLLLVAVLRRLTVTTDPAVEQRLRSLVAETRRDVLRELRRIGLPGRTWSLPWLAIRLLGRRRANTLAKLRTFEVERVVPAARLDELHLLLRIPGGRTAQR